ncbi:apolipoprotein L6 [Carlito syrichta]|uniref:Apolipoprotein L6 n=1 Tax=Carlito syrichta TaxID=1868482 RepID=A0A1U7TQD7_CARSF|nr:apolipoprotein L6 [Carlito syrichta]
MDLQLEHQTSPEHDTDVGLQSGEDDDPLYEDEELQDGDLSAEEIRFLGEFPRLKHDIEETIGKLHALADDSDNSHKTFTKTKMVVSSMSVVSEVAAILGLVLAPTTGGGSLLFSVASHGLGTAAGVASIVNGMWNRSRNKKAQVQASELVPTQDQEDGEAETIIDSGTLVYKVGTAVKNIKRDIRALKTAKNSPRLVNAAKRLQTTGRVSARTSKQVQKAFGGTTLAMTKHTRMLGGTMAVLSLGSDLAALSNDWKQLKEGTRTEFAEYLRAHAGRLERKLTELTQQYESLQQVRS